MSLFPKQRLSKSAKTEKWSHENIDFFIAESNFGANNKRDLEELYQAYNGQIPDKNYNYVTDPYNSKAKNGGKQTLNYPARIRNFNIIKPVIDLLMGEKSKRFMNFQVVTRNSDVISKREAEVFSQVGKSLEQLFINEVNAMGVQSGVDSQETPPPPEVANLAQSNYLDERAIMGQNAIDYIRDYNELPEHHQTCFFDWLITGQCYTYKSVHAQEVHYEPISPRDIAHDNSPGVDFVEDGAWVVVRRMMSLSEVQDRFYDILDDAQVKLLDENGYPKATQSSFFTSINSIGNSTGMNNISSPSAGGRLVEVFHVVWKTLTKRGELNYIDEVGMPQKMWVDEDYKVDIALGETIKWHWLNEVMEGYKIDGKHYVGVGVCEIQRNEMNNKSRCKLPYNGRIYSDRHADNISIAQMGVQYNILYNIYHYRFELTMAKSKDKIILMEYNAIPKRHGWDEDKFMYTADAMGFMFVDTVKDGKSSIGGFNQFQVLDASLGQYAAATMDVLRGLKQEWEELVGFNAPRKGQTAASDGLGKMQQSIFQSSVITEELFRKYEKFQEREYQGCLDVSKYAWKEGKKTAYVTSDLRQLLLDIDPISYQEAEYGIRAMNSGEENDHLNQLKQFAQSFAQNGSTPSTVAEILSANSIAKLTKLLKIAEAEQQRMSQEQAKSEQEGQQQLQAMQQQALEGERTWKSTEAALDRESEYTIESMKVEAQVLLNNEDNAGAVAGAASEKLQLKQQELDIKQQAMLNDIIKHRELLAEKSREREAIAVQEEKNRNVERQKISSQEKIAKNRTKGTSGR